jgi:hypothetical protein
MPIVLFGKEFWSQVLHMDALVEWGTISPEDIDLFFQTDSVDEAFEYLVTELSAHAVADPGPSM